MVAQYMLEHDDTKPTGVILGHVTLVDCVSLADLPPEYAHLESSPWALRDFVWAWILKDPVAYRTPVPCRGQMGLFTPPPGLSELHRYISSRSKGDRQS